MAEKVGAFWKKELADGRVVYNGHITHNGEKIKLNLWVGDKGDNPKRPDLNAYLDTYVPKAKDAEEKALDEATAALAEPDGDDGIPF
jgi:hypothetical protein